MSGDPLVSVVIPCYRSERTVGATISSALTQTYPHVEVIVCLDGVVDRSDTIVAGYGDLVRVLQQDNQGVAAARNTGVQAAHGELIAVVDADDTLLPHYLSRAVDLWQRREVQKSYVTSNAYIMGSAGIVPRRTVLPRKQPPYANHRLALLQRNIVSGHALYPRAMHDELGGFDTTMRVLEDYDFWIRAAFAGWHTLYQREPAALYRRAGGSLTEDAEEMAGFEYRLRATVRERFADQLTEEEWRYLDGILGLETQDVHLARGDAALRAGRRGEAATEYEAASMLVPWDRRLRLKSAALRFVPPAGAFYRWREQVRSTETSRS